MYFEGYSHPSRMRHNRSIEGENFELHCLVNIYELGVKSDTIDDFLNETINYLPKAFENILELSIKFQIEKIIYSTKKLQNPSHSFSRDVLLKQERIGKIFFDYTYRSKIAAISKKQFDNSLMNIAFRLEKILCLKIAQRRLSENEARLRLLAENMPVFLAAYDDDLNYVAWNKTAERITGYSAELALGGRKVDELCYPDAHKREKMFAEWFKLEGECYNWEWDIVCKDGTIKTIAWYDISKKCPIPGWRNWAIGIDVTAQKQAKEALRKSKIRLEHALDATKHALWEFNIQDGSSYFSDTYFNMLGYENIVADNLEEIWQKLIHPDDKRHAFDAFYKSCQKGNLIDVEFRMRSCDSQWKWIQCRGKVAEKGIKGQPLRIVGTHADITREKNKELLMIRNEANLKRENLRLKSSVKDRFKFQDIIGKSPAMQEVYDLIQKASDSDNNVIICGESGTGKELVAKAIHRLSERSMNRFIPINCAAISETILESELFGYKKGAFTGAFSDKAGLLEKADKGTLFMDEVGEISLNMQTKMLRVIEKSGYIRVGGTRTRKSDLRIIAATNKDIQKLLTQNRIRRDFYYRICVIPIFLPPLRQRKEDIMLLTDYFIKTIKNDSNYTLIPAALRDAFMEYDWPGNVRELQNVIQRYLSLKRLDIFDGKVPRSALKEEINEFPLDLNISGQPSQPKLNELRANIEKKYILKLLGETRWNKRKTASILGINRRTLYRKLAMYEIK